MTLIVVFALVLAALEVSALLRTSGERLPVVIRWTAWTWSGSLAAGVLLLVVGGPTALAGELLLAVGVVLAIAWLLWWVAAGRRRLVR
jgi:hypothetical protein